MSSPTGKFHFLKPVAFVLLLAAALKIFVLDAVVVSSSSMERTLRPGDFLLIDKTGYAPLGAARKLLAGPGFLFPSLARGAMPDRGEVVAFTFEGRSAGSAERGSDPDAIILKRCIAVSGDSIGFTGGKLEVNGVPVAAPADPGEFFAGRAPGRVPKSGDILPLDSAGCPLWHDLIVREGHELDVDADGHAAIDGVRSTGYTVERNYIFVIGDNLSASRDSRSWGFLPADRVIGRAILIYWSLAGDGSVRWDRVGTFVD